MSERADAAKLTVCCSFPERQMELLEMVRQGSVVTWQHGEYDFADEKLQDSVGLETPKNLDLSVV